MQTTSMVGQNSSKKGIKGVIRSVLVITYTSLSLYFSLLVSLMTRMMSLHLTFLTSYSSVVLFWMIDARTWYQSPLLLQTFMNAYESIWPRDQQDTLSFFFVLKESSCWFEPKKVRRWVWWSWLSVNSSTCPEQVVFPVFTLFLPLTCMTLKGKESVQRSMYFSPQDVFRQNISRVSSVLFLLISFEAEEILWGNLVRKVYSFSRSNSSNSVASTGFACDRDSLVTLAVFFPFLHYLLSLPFPL